MHKKATTLDKNLQLSYSPNILMHIPFTTSIIGPCNKKLYPDKSESIDTHLQLPNIPARHPNDQKNIVNRGIIRMCERVAASGGTLTPYSA